VQNFLKIGPFVEELKRGARPNTEPWLCFTF